MMNHIWYTFHIPSVRNHPDMILEHYNIAALPLFNVIYIRGQADRCMFKIYFQVLYSSEINIFIRLIDIIILRILPDIFVYQFPQIISAFLKRISDNICTDTISVIRITGLIISALVNRPLLHINQCILQNIGLIIRTVTIFIHTAMIRCDLCAVVFILWPVCLRQSYHITFCQKSAKGQPDDNSDWN